MSISTPPAGHLAQGRRTDLVAVGVDEGRRQHLGLLARTGSGRLVERRVVRARVGVLLRRRLLLLDLLDVSRETVLRLIVRRGLLGRRRGRQQRRERQRHERRASLVIGVERGHCGRPSFCFGFASSPGEPAAGAPVPGPSRFPPQRLPERAGPALSAVDIPGPAP
jgi:hypothetical protein